MESESMEWENPVAYWQQPSRQALEGQRVVVPPLRRLPGYPVSRRPPEFPPGVVNVGRRLQRSGLDLICNSCGQHITKSEELQILCHFYAPDHGPWGSPLTRCFLRCTNCFDDLVLGQNIGDADKFVVITGATQQFPAADVVPDLQNEAYPDDVLDSANDLHTHVLEGTPELIVHLNGRLRNAYSSTPMDPYLRLKYASRSHIYHLLKETIALTLYKRSSELK